MRMRRVILASQSKARKLIFSSLGIPFETYPANIDEESITHKNQAKRAEILARTKAETVASKKDGIIIAADTFDIVGKIVMEKPKSIIEAKKMLKILSENNAIGHTGFCYIDKLKKINFSTSVSTHYRFRKLYKNEIDLYINLFPVTEWAGGFALVGPYMNTFIAKVNGSLNGLAYGLPTEILIPLLKKSGFEPRPAK